MTRGVPFSHLLFLLIVKSTLPKSFADITSSNLEDAPPSAVSHVDQHPVYDEETVYLENAKREERKHIQVEHGNNEQLIKEEKGELLEYLLCTKQRESKYIKQ